MRNSRKHRAAMVIAGVLLCCACTKVNERRATGAVGSADAGPHEGDSSADREPASAAGSGASGGQKMGGLGNGENPLTAGTGGSSGTERSSAAAAVAGGTTAAAGSGGAVGMQPMAAPVRGKLMDALRRPLGNVEVHIGGQVVKTDEVGKFTAEAVGATYDVAFRLMTVAFRDGSPISSVWRFEGLTRRDPTLQVYPTFELQSADVTYTSRGITFPLPEDQRIQTVIGGPAGDCGTGVNTEVYEWTGCYWDGPETTTATAHGIWYTVSEDDLPLEYLGHDTTPTTLAARVTSEIGFDFSVSKPSIEAIAGRVDAPGQGVRSNWIVLRWGDGSSVLLGADENASDRFLYNVPTIPDASAAVVALRGRNFEYPLSVAFSDNLTAGQTGIQIALPQPAAVIGPGDGQTNANADTTFQWSGDAKVFLFVAATDDSKEQMHVVTSAKQIELPVSPAAPYTPPAGAKFAWHVETHGDYASIDEAAGGEGLISAFFGGSLHGPRRGSGSYTASAQRTFTTAN